MVNERERASKLDKIITDTKAKHKTHIEVEGPMSGDGHSFNDSYDYNEIIDKTWYVPENSFSEMRMARKELKKIYENTNDEDLKIICEEGINHEHVKFGLSEYIVSGLILTAVGGVGYFLYLTKTN